MRLSVSTNFDDALLEGLAGTEVECVYGKLSEDAVGGGRPSVMLPAVDRDRLARHVARAHELGLEFNYLLNASCMDNRELTKKGYGQLAELIDWLRSVKVDAVTVTMSVLIPILRERAPDLPVAVSSLAIIDTVEKARQFERLGVEELTLYEDLNRNFALLRKLRRSVSCDLRLIATNSCLPAVLSRPGLPHQRQRPCVASGPCHAGLSRGLAHPRLHRGPAGQPGGAAQGDLHPPRGPAPLRGARLRPLQAHRALQDD